MKREEVEALHRKFEIIKVSYSSSKLLKWNLISQYNTLLFPLYIQMHKKGQTRTCSHGGGLREGYQCLM